MSDGEKLELPITIERAERLSAMLCAGKIEPAAAAGEFVSVLRWAKLESNELTFRQLGARVQGIRSQACVNRALSMRTPKIARWVVVEAILVVGMSAGPATVQAVRTAWVRARQAESADGHAA